jgi:hypothetical protein
MFASKAAALSRGGFFARRARTGSNAGRCVAVLKTPPRLAIGTQHRRLTA